MSSKNIYFTEEFNKPYQIGNRNKTKVAKCGMATLFKSKIKSFISTI